MLIVSFLHDVVTPSGKAFGLQNLPYFLSTQIDKYLEWMITSS